MPLVESPVWGEYPLLKRLALRLLLLWWVPQSPHVVTQQKRKEQCSEEHSCNCAYDSAHARVGCRLTPGRSDADGPSRPHWQPTWHVQALTFLIHDSSFLGNERRVHVSLWKSRIRIR